MRHATLCPRGTALSTVETALLKKPLWKVPEAPKWDTQMDDGQVLIPGADRPEGGPRADASDLSMRWSVRPERGGRGSVPRTCIPNPRGLWWALTHGRSLCSPTDPMKGSVPKRVQVPTYLVHPIVQGHDCQVLDVFALLGALQFYQ